jgi:hypothetical protein
MYAREIAMIFHASDKMYMNLKFVEDWIRNNDFSRICEEAEAGNRNCAVFINKFMTELNALHFHLHNKSHDNKIQNQINKLENILEDYSSQFKLSRP